MNHPIPPARPMVEPNDYNDATDPRHAEAPMDATLLAYLAIAALVLIAAAGAPLPVSGALTAAGALAAAAKLDLIALVCVATVGAVAGDVLGYAAGRVSGGWLRQKRQTQAPWLAWVHRHILNVRSVRQIVAWSDGMLRRRGGMSMTLLLSRTVLSAFGPVVNVLSGTRRYSLRRFLLLDLLGELLWASAYIGVGFFAGPRGGDIRAVLSSPVVIGSFILLTVGPMIVVAWVRQHSPERTIVHANVGN